MSSQSSQSSRRVRFVDQSSRHGYPQTPPHAPPLHYPPVLPYPPAAFPAAVQSSRPVQSQQGLLSPIICQIPVPTVGASWCGAGDGNSIQRVEGGDTVSDGSISSNSDSTNSPDAPIRPSIDSHLLDGFHTARPPFVKAGAQALSPVAMLPVPPPVPTDAPVLIHSSLRRFPLIWNVRRCHPQGVVRNLVINEPAFPGDLPKTCILRFSPPMAPSGHGRDVTVDRRAGSDFISVDDVLKAIEKELISELHSAWIMPSDPFYSIAAANRAHRNGGLTWRRVDLWPSGDLYFQGLRPEPRPEHSDVVYVVELRCVPPASARW